MKIRDAWFLMFGSAEDKFRTRRRLLKRDARRLGYYLYSGHMVWKDQDFFTKAREATRHIDGISDPRCFVLQSVLRSLDHVAGDVAECGVRQGRSTMFMLHAGAKPRLFHLFDSFAGLSKPTSEDIPKNGDIKWAEGDLSTDETVARKNLNGFNNLFFHVGWLPGTLNSVSDRRFAMVHIDVDLYEPTRDALSFFWQRMEIGGCIVCDDYGSAKCPGARRAFDEFFAVLSEGIVELPTGQAVVQKRC